MENRRFPVKLFGKEFFGSEEAPIVLHAKQTDNNAFSKVSTLPLLEPTATLIRFLKVTREALKEGRNPAPSDVVKALSDYRDQLNSGLVKSTETSYWAQTSCNSAYWLRQ